MDQLLMKLIELVEKTSPELWRMALKQVYAEVVADIILSIVLLGILIGLIFLFKRIKKEKEKCTSYEVDSYCDIGLILVGISFFIPTIWIIVNVYFICLKLVNPEYYAIQTLLGLIK